MLNIEVQCCGLSILLVILYFSSTREHAGLTSTRAYQRALMMNTICVVLDILSIFGIVYSGRVFPFWVTVFVCKLYLISLVWACFMSFSYAVSDIGRTSRNPLIRFFFPFLACAASGGILVSPLEIFSEGRVVYSYGPAVNVTFVVGPLFILGTVLITFVYGKYMNPHRKQAVRVWMLIQIAAVGAQFLNRSLLLVGFSTSLGMIILFMELENPVNEIDRVAGVFGSQVLHEFIRQLYEEEKHFSGFILCTSDNWNMERDEEHELMVEIAGMLKEVTGAKVFRSTGNDFTVVYDEPGERAERDAEKLEERLSRRLTKEAGLRFVFVVVPDNRVAHTPEEVTVMYHHLRTGLFSQEKRIFVVDEKAAARLRNSKLIHQAVQEALEEDRVEVFYQPIYSISEQRFVSAEALARIRNRDGSLMMPDQFIPVAEEMGHIGDLGTRVFEKVCELYRNREAELPGIRYIEVNLSVSQCEDRGLPEKYREIMEKAEISPSKLNLEITESSSIQRRNVILDNMNRMKEYGSSFSLDDFGSGASNLNYIMDMPVDIVKFDRVLVREYFVNEKAKFVMDSAIDMIRKMKLKIVAEGIEEEEQLKTMAELGVDYIQGYYFSKPLPEEEFLRFLKEHGNAG